jgi:hypothetical protein
MRGGPLKKIISFIFRAALENLAVFRLLPNSTSVVLWLSGVAGFLYISDNWRATAYVAALLTALLLIYCVARRGVQFQEEAESYKEMREHRLDFEIVRSVFSHTELTRYMSGIETVSYSVKLTNGRHGPVENVRVYVNSARDGEGNKVLSNYSTIPLETMNKHPDGLSLSEGESERVIVCERLVRKEEDPVSFCFQGGAAQLGGDYESSGPFEIDLRVVSSAPPLNIPLLVSKQGCDLLVELRPQIAWAGLIGVRAAKKSRGVASI